MVFSIDIRRIKQDSYRIIRQDGLSDICAGLMLGIMAVFFLDFKYAGALIVGCAMQTIILPVCRKKFTYPRIGYAKFPGRADIKSLIVWDIALPLIIVALIICVGIWVWFLLPLCLGIFLGGLALVGARITGYVLDYILAAVLLASGLIGLLLIQLGYAPGVATAYQLWGLSGIFIPVGLVQLIRFLQKYPQPEMEVSNDDEN
ncbi:MAG: hypothetical protein H8D56_22770 [Planctomycetes bacterium]|nr:hypothetical protein [Planctomycetota bacterium]